MATSCVVPDSIDDAKEELYKLLIDWKRDKMTHHTIEAILLKHPDLLNFEYNREMGFKETPLLLACDGDVYDEGK